MSRIVIVRHGNTFEASEAPRRIGARTDLPLTAEGQDQARALGDAFRHGGFRFVRALTSPLRRTRRTAELVLDRQSPAPPLETASWLIEIDHGVDEGAPETQVVARVGQGVLDAWDRYGVAPPGWRVDTSALREAWLDLFAIGGDGDTLVVTSNGIARFALLAAFDPLPPSLRLRTGAYGVVEWMSGSGPALKTWDQRP